MMTGTIRALAVATACLLLGVGLVNSRAMAADPPAQAAEAAPAPVVTLAPSSPPPDASALKDGLAVHYYYGRFVHVDRLVDWMGADQGEEGPSLPALDYASGAGMVLTSQAPDLVGAHITGFIELPRAGTYTFQVTSNDGVRIKLGGVELYEDPGVHQDETSPPLPVAVAAPGWYPLDLLYFEKKGTASLRLAWRDRADGAFEPVPPSAFRH